MYDLRRLRVLRELKHRGTLGAVATALAYSPSAISQQLAQLEAEVGVPLLEPDGRRVRLTPQALILVEHTEAVLAELDRAESAVAASLDDVVGTVRVAAFQTAAHGLLPAAVRCLASRHPSLRVHLVHLEPEVALPALAARDLDLVVAEEYAGFPHRVIPGLHREQLVLDPMRLALPGGASGGACGGASGGALRADAPVGAATASGTASGDVDLAAVPWVLEPSGTYARRWAESRCRLAGFEPDVRYESTDVLLHVHLVRQGLAAGILPDLVWAGATPDVRLLDAPGGATHRRLVTVVREGAETNPALVALRTALREGVDALGVPGVAGSAAVA